MSVISVGLVALMQSSQYSAYVLEQAKTKTAAYHVADQVILNLYQVSGLRPGRHQGEKRFEGVNYYWQATLSATENNQINRLDVEVSLDRKFDYFEASLTGFKKP
jgi:ABC-type tungstate transport system permease subunit